LLSDATLEQIALRCGMEVDVAMLFESLHWNCRARLDERVYLARICSQGIFARATGASARPKTSEW
jgi:hypothetical protein